MDRYGYGSTGCAPATPTGTVQNRCCVLPLIPPTTTAPPCRSEIGLAARQTCACATAVGRFRYLTTLVKFYVCVARPVSSAHLSWRVLGVSGTPANSYTRSAHAQLLFSLLRKSSWSCTRHLANKRRLMTGRSKECVLVVPLHFGNLLAQPFQRCCKRVGWVI